MRDETDAGEGGADLAVLYVTALTTVTASIFTRSNNTSDIRYFLSSRYQADFCQPVAAA